jgi:hypothetical protein
MAKGKKDKGGEKGLIKEKASHPDLDEEIEESDSEDEGGEKGASETSGKSGIHKGISFRKWLLYGVPVLILIVCGVAILLKPGLLNMITGKKPAIPSIDLSNDNLQEATLSPFFIPPSSDLSRGAVRVDLTVVWDGLAAVRYKSNELRIRAEAYEYLVKFAENAVDLNSQKAVMEEGMSGIFRTSLGVKDLAVRIKELKFI